MKRKDRKPIPIILQLDNTPESQVVLDALQKRQIPFKSFHTTDGLAIVTQYGTIRGRDIFRYFRIP